MRRRLRNLVIIAFLIVAILVFPIWLYNTTSRQEQLNADLIIACRLGQVEDARELLKQGANPNARDLPDVRPGSVMHQLIELITRPPHLDIINARTALSCATDSKHAFALVTMLLAKGASIRADDDCVQPALAWAARGGDLATVRLLLDHGADINNRDRVGFSALQGAVLADKPELVRLLLDRGAPLTGSTIMGQPLSSMTNSAEIVRMLNAKAHANARSK